jgi:hypothetical protein
VRRLLLAVALTLAIASPVAAAPRLHPGTISMDPAWPTYGQPITASWQLVKKPQLPSLGLICYQPAGTSAFVSEWQVPADLSGTLTVAITPTSGVRLDVLDFAQKADCQIYLFDDLRGANGKGTILTNVIGFEVAP